MRRNWHDERYGFNGLVDVLRSGMADYDALKDARRDAADEIERLTLRAETFERQYRQACQDHDAVKAERDEARAAVKGWHRSALAMRDAAIRWDGDGRNRYETIERIYFDAAMGIRYVDEQKGGHS